MVKLIIFDLDGVLVEARDIHYEALNRALTSIDPIYLISREEHLASYDGLPTKKKLVKLTKEKGLPESHYDEVWKRKQYFTSEVILETVKFEDHLDIRETLSKLHARGYRVYCASNSIRSSMKLMLEAARKQSKTPFGNLSEVHAGGGGQPKRMPSRRRLTRWKKSRPRVRRSCLRC